MPRELEFRGFFRAFIGERDLHPYSGKQFAQTLCQGVKAVDGLLENRRSGWKVTFVPVLRVFPVCFSLLVGLPFRNSVPTPRHRERISSSSQSEAR